MDGAQIRINMPQLTRERRLEMIKLLHKRTEEARIALRNIRRSAIEDLKEYEDIGEISEDDLERGESEVQKIIEGFTTQIEDMTKAKEKEMMEV